MRRKRRKPACASFVAKIINDVATNKRAQRRLHQLLMTLISFELFQRANVLESHDDTDVEWLFDRALDWKRAADTHLGYSLQSAKRSRRANKNILIIDVSRPLQPEKNDMSNLAPPPRSSLDRRRRGCRGQCENRDPARQPDRKCR